MQYKQRMPEEGAVLKIRKKKVCFGKVTAMIARYIILQASRSPLNAQVSIH